MSAPLSVSCPLCHAPVGEPCRNVMGAYYREVTPEHAARVQATSDAEHLTNHDVFPDEHDHDWADGICQYPTCDERVPDMSEAFQRDAEVRAEAESLYPFLPDDSESMLSLKMALQSAFIAGAEWGSRPF